MLTLIHDRCGGSVGQEIHLSGHPGNWTRTETLQILLRADAFSRSEISRIRAAFPDDQIDVVVADPDDQSPPPPMPSSATEPD